jgi:hypothetical protein
MMPITDFLSCTRVFDEFDSLSPARRRHAKTYGIGLVAARVRANLGHSLKEAVYNLLSWVRDNDNRGIDDLIEKIGYLFVHSTAGANVQS